MKLQAKTHSVRDECFIRVETRARCKDALTVDYRGENGGTVITGPEEAFQEILRDIKAQRQEYWEEMVNADSNSSVDRLEKKRRSLRTERNGLRNAIENPNHRWREDGR